MRSRCRLGKKQCKEPNKINGDMKMNIEVIESKLGDLFDNAIDVDDTIWYSKTETLYDAIIYMLREELQKDKRSCLRGDDKNGRN